ncbi:MAG: hypothetical protein J5760_00540 [Clostridia bacterium]|nr:hypothetical protein [Clostridia bacterium]
MFKKTLALILAALIAAAALCSCGGDNGSGKPASATSSAASQAPVTSQEPVSQAPVSAGKVRAVFYDRGTQLGDTGELEKGTVLEPVDYTVNEDAANTYEFLGWDADGDGVAETFPYTLETDTEFSAILKITPKVYHYDIYVRDELKASADAHYGDAINYPEVQSFIEGEDVFIFLGWKYDGVFDGMMRMNVEKDVRIDACFADTQVLKLYYSGGMFARRVDAGAALPSLADWNVYPQDGYKIVWYADQAFTQRMDIETMPEGNLTLYGRQEPADSSSYSRIQNDKQLIDVFNTVLLARRTSVDLLLDYSYGTLNDVMSCISDNAISLYGYKLSASTSDGVNVKIKVTYEPLATVRSSKTVYTQLQSANLTISKSDRGESFNKFAVDKLETAYPVNNSEALYYVLENGMRPIIDSSATETAQIYAAMKAILREYVSDSMTDIEKAAAIYEYLIMSTTYDGELLKKVTAGADTAGNRSFCLEGVFIDRLAVCDGFSKAFCCLCRIEGIECVRVTGKKVSGGVSHAWNKVKLGGKWYIVDVTSGGTIVENDEVLTYRYFMITDKQNEKTCKPDKGCHTDIKCTAEYDVYAPRGLEPKSVEEAASLLKAYINAAPAGKSTFEIKLGYKVSSDSAAIQDILNKLNMSVSISYTGTDGIYCFIYDK